MVKRLLNQKKFPKQRQGVFKKNRHCFDKCTFGDRTLAHSGAKVQSRFSPGDLVTRTGDREIRSVSGRLPDYPGELACMVYITILEHNKVSDKKLRAKRIQTILDFPFHKNENQFCVKILLKSLL